MRRIFWDFCRNWSPTLRLGESGSRYGESGSRFSIFFKIYHHFKQLNQPFKRSFWQERSQGCNVLSPLIYLKVWTKLYLWAILSFFDYEYLPKFEAKIRTARNVVYTVHVRDLCRIGLCKNARKSAKMPCPFKHFHVTTQILARTCWTHY